MYVHLHRHCLKVLCFNVVFVPKKQLKYEQCIDKADIEVIMETDDELRNSIILKRR